MGKIEGLLSEQERFIPRDGAQTLAVLFTPLHFPAGLFAYERSFSSRPVHRLHVRDDSNGLFTCRIERIRSIVEAICSEYGVARRVYWGSSAGAYGAIMAAIDDPDAVGVAVSPHLYLEHPFSVAAGLRDSGVVFGSRHLDVRDSLSKAGSGHPIHLFFPLRSGKDAVHVVDAMALRGERVSCHFMTCHHGIEAELKAVGAYDAFINSLLVGEMLPECPLVASPPEIAEAVIMKELYEAEYSEAVADTRFAKASTNNYELMYWASRQQFRRGDVFSAIGMGLKAIEIVTNAPPHYHVTLANFAFTAGLWSLAVEHYERGFGLERESGIASDPGCLENYEFAKARRFQA